MAKKNHRRIHHLLICETCEEQMETVDKDSKMCDICDSIMCEGCRTLTPSFGFGIKKLCKLCHSISDYYRKEISQIWCEAQAKIVMQKKKWREEVKRWS